METKTVRVESWGCALFPHKTLHSTDRRLDISASETIEVKPESTITDRFGFKHESLDSCFGKETYFPNGVSLNDFLRLGYYSQSGKMTGHFTDREYVEFEKYANAHPDSSGREDSRYKPVKS